jgi:hypothetical protein
MQIGDEAIPGPCRAILELQGEIDRGADEIAGLQVVAL